MNGRRHGNFIVISGLLILTFIALVTYGALKMRDSEPTQQKPIIVGTSEKPSIYGSSRAVEKVDSTPAQPLGENKGLEVVQSSDPDADAKLLPAPERIRNTKETGRWIYIDKANFRLYLADGAEVVDSWGIALGKNTGNKQKSGDNRTPEGTFTIQQIQDSRSWTHDFKDGKGVIKNAYGPWFIRLKTGWSGIGIHGTHDPDSIGTLATEGCVRMRNEDLQKLKDQVKVGLKVVITPNAQGAKSQAPAQNRAEVNSAALQKPPATRQPIIAAKTVTKVTPKRATKR